MRRLKRSPYGRPPVRASAEANYCAQQTQLTTELNEANYTLQEIPSELDEVNELYSAITGYNESTSGQ